MPIRSELLSEFEDLKHNIMPAHGEVDFATLLNENEEDVVSLVLFFENLISDMDDGMMLHNWSTNEALDFAFDEVTEMVDVSEIKPCTILSDRREIFVEICNERDLLSTKFLFMETARYYWDKGSDPETVDYLNGRLCGDMRNHRLRMHQLDSLLGQKAAALN